MMECTDRLSLEELITRPTAELRIVGADGTDDQDDNAPDDQDDQDSDDESTEDDDDAEDDKGSKLDSKDRKIKSLDEEVKRHYKRRKDAEEERDNLKKQLEDLQKNGTDDEALKKQVGDLQTQNAKLIETLQKTQIQNSFFGTAGFKWKSPEDAFKLLDLDGVELDDNKVVGMEAAIQKLAADKPWLLDEAEDDDKPKPKRRTSGKPPAGSNGSDEKSQQVRKATYESKYPGLRR